ncbi:MAG: hypothetical protein LBR20_06475 [Propionibacteriaceae bacterium]|jgi:hypothetical protein|nr:hypothetical protein [Propionibacteriaceae bacterium]
MGEHLEIVDEDEDYPYPEEEEEEDNPYLDALGEYMGAMSLYHYSNHLADNLLFTVMDLGLEQTAPPEVLLEAIAKKWKVKPEELLAEVVEQANTWREEMAKDDPDDPGNLEHYAADPRRPMVARLLTLA